MELTDETKTQQANNQVREALLALMRMLARAIAQRLKSALELPGGVACNADGGEPPASKPPQ